LVSSASYNDNVWHTAAFNRDRQNGTLIVDGVAVAEGSSPGNTQVTILTKIRRKQSYQQCSFDNLDDQHRPTTFLGWHFTGSPQQWTPQLQRRRNRSGGLYA
jgi:Laminin G domain